MAIDKIDKYDVYLCEICGNIVELIHTGKGHLVCCGQVMTKLAPKSKSQEGKEKHVPVIEVSGSNVTVKVGSVPHPMVEEHYIVMIELVKGKKVVASSILNPGDKPEATFVVAEPKGITAREVCNKHGLWTS